MESQALTYVAHAISVNLAAASPSIPMVEQRSTAIRGAGSRRGTQTSRRDFIKASRLRKQLCRLVRHADTEIFLIIRAGCEEHERRAAEAGMAYARGPHGGLTEAGLCLVIMLSSRFIEV